jgi:hypothetical protein
MAGSTWLEPQENFAVSGNWGTFGGFNAFAVTGAARIDQTWSLNAGIGVEVNTGLVGGRAGIRAGW